MREIDCNADASYAVILTFFAVFPQAQKFVIPGLTRDLVDNSTRIFLTTLNVINFQIS